MHLIVADNEKDEAKDNIHIHGVKGYKNRFLRMTLAVWSVYRRAKTIKTDIYIIHDPELLSVITNHTKKILGVYNKNIFVLHNYALLKEFSECKQPDMKHTNHILYCGAISQARGIFQAIKALELCHNDIKLILCGSFAPSSLMEQCKLLPGWDKVAYMGHVDRTKLKQLSQKCFCGMCCILPTKAYTTTCSTKIFEYAGMYLPVIASGFDSWRKIISNENKPFGLLADPESPQEIANAVDKLYENKALAKQLGENGRKAIEAKYNFETEMEEYLNWLKQ